MKSQRSSRNVAMATAAGVLVAGIAAISIPALANVTGGKATAVSTKAKPKVTVAKPSNKSVSTPTTPPSVGPVEDGDNDGGFDAPDGQAGDGDNHGGFGPGDGQAGQALKDVLADLVTKGTITQAQSDAVTSALAAKRTAEQTARDAIRAKFDAIVAGVLGLTTEEFATQMKNHTLPQPTDAQRQEIKTKLDALRTSLGLPAEGPNGPAGGPGMRGGFGHHH
jgi:hypothetical protein